MNALNTHSPTHHQTSFNLPEFRMAGSVALSLALTIQSLLSPPGCPHLEPSSRDHWTNPGRSVTPLSCSLHVGLLAVSRMLCRIKRTVIFSPRSPPPPPFLFLLIFNIPFFLQSSRLNFLSETISVGVLEKCCIVQNDSHTCCLSWVYCVQETSPLTSDCFIRLLGWLAGAGQVRSVHTNRV